MADETEDMANDRHFCGNARRFSRIESGLEEVQNEVEYHNEAEG